MNDSRDDSAGKPNHLAGETSPYLLQHLYNPVDWYPWGEEALDRARDEDKPIFLSIGYAACHWCHVMERESFENPDVAGTLNDGFVAIKVDREERPDIDEIYMNAIQLLTGQGGWPLNVFLTPELEPFFGGTYFPPGDAYGRPAFTTVLRQIVDAWKSRRREIAASAAELRGHLERAAEGSVSASSGSPVGAAAVSRAAAELAGRFDGQWGGFSAAPKFPSDGALALLLDLHAIDSEEVPRQMAERTLDAMALGGLYDHVGGGFARYSVDERWLVPHFEKMLYNQALLVPVYLDAWLATRKPMYRRVVEQTLDFVGRELTDPRGGFYSSLDADSEGVEGKFYVWTPDEVEQVLGPKDAAVFCSLYEITEAGNFEGRSIPNLLRGSLEQRADELGTTERQLVDRTARLRERLLEARGARVRPATDDKVLTSWNGLMITAFARAYQHLGREADLGAARAAADFATEHLLTDGSRLFATYRQGRSKLNAYLDDYAFLGRGLVDLYEACFDKRYLVLARTLARTILERFEDPRNGGFLFTSDDHEKLLTRNRSTHDGALPSGAAVAVELLLRLAVHFDENRFRESAKRTLEAYGTAVERMPSAFATLLLASRIQDRAAPEIAIVGSPDDRGTRLLLEVVRSRYRRRPIVQLGAAETEGLALLAGKQAVDGRATAFVCRDYGCRAPTSSPEELAAQLGDGGSGSALDDRG